MARNRLLRTKIREVKELIKAELEAQQAFKDSPKGLKKSIREHLGRIVDRIDIPEMVAIIGVAHLVKSSIDWTQIVALEVLPKYEFLFPYLEFMTGMKAPSIAELTEKAKGSVQSDAIKWLLSFSASYLIVHNFGALVQAGTNIIGLAKGLLLSS